MKRILSAGFALALTLPCATAQTPAPAAAPKSEKAAVATLKVGDKAPALTIEKWVKGAPVASFERGKVYMVEFWATWCPPCIASMPHVTSLQKKYGERGLTVIGVTRPDSRGNTLPKVEAMVADKGDAGMGYTVAWDGSSKTNEVFMQAAQEGGIPCSFLVDREGYIAYIGHPAKIDATLELVLAGKHDIQALAAAAVKTKETQAKAAAIQQRMGTAAHAKDWDELLALTDDLIALEPKTYGRAAQGKLHVLLGAKHDVDGALAYARTVFEGFGKDDASVLNELASTLVDFPKPLERTDNELALKMASRAVELTERKDAAILDTLARAHFAQGDVAQAIVVETEAVALDPKLKDTLDEYVAAKDGKKVGN